MKRILKMALCVGELARQVSAKTPLTPRSKIELHRAFSRRSTGKGNIIHLIHTINLD